LKPTFWNSKRVVITGGAGMVGSMLVQLLLDERANVTVLDDFSRGQTQIESKFARYVKMDAGNRALCEKWFVGADAVFNLAAFVAGVTYNQDHQTQMFTQNMRLQAAPVMAAKNIGIKRFLQISSVCVYAEERQNPCLEDHVGGEPNPSNAGYAWAKRMGERIAAWSGLEHCVIVRPANIYGVRDYFDERAHVIPALIKKCLSDDVIRVNGTGQEVREFLYVTDAARGMMTALERGEAGQVYNIGSDGANSCTISELVYILRGILKADKSIEFTGGNSGDSRRIVNGDKLMRLDWKAEMPLRTGLETVCDWYKEQCGKST
jgi:GDP-L-fucose synthase